MDHRKFLSIERELIDQSDEEEMERDTEDLEEDQIEDRSQLKVAYKQLPPHQPRKSKEQQEQEEMERAINTYQEGATSQVKMAAALNMKPYQAVPLLEKATKEMKRREQEETNSNG